MEIHKFEAFKRELQTSNFFKMSNMEELSDFYYKEISERSYNFGRNDTQINQLYFLRKTDLLMFFEVSI